ncbi:MAG TPA: isoprenylcysteine carboxylmethyltransferase family protein [Anaerolineales bacterium]|nr:isoprenylcysteine carboxylmethyltransferase family protein [Anaerolineales bacterium]
MARPSRLRQRLSDLRPQGLTFQVFLFIVLPLAVLLIAILFGSLTLHSQAMRVLVGERDQRASQAASAAITEQLNHRAAAIRGLALYAERATPASPNYAQLLADYDFLLPDFDGGLLLTAFDGTFLASSNSPNVWQTPSVAELLRQTKIQDEAKFSPTFINSAGNQPMMLVMAKSPEGLIAVGAFSPASLAQRSLGDGFSSSGQDLVVIVDNKGQVLYEAGIRPVAEWDLAQHPGVVEALRGESGTTYLSVDGSEHVIAFSPVTPVGWALVIEEPWEAVDNPLLQRTQAAPLILIPVLLFALIALGFGIRQIVQPLRLLERQASELAWGRFEAIEKPVGGIGEIRHLQAELILMAQKMNPPGPPAYGLWSLVILNAAIFIIFAFSFAKPRTTRDWRSFGAFSAFLVALFTEMYSFPLTIYLLSGWLASLYPGIDLLSHNAGHLWQTLLGWKGDPHFTPIHWISDAFIVGGFILIGAAWDVLYKAQRAHQIATTGPYAYMRHPQYVGFIVIMIGFLIQWPTLITLIMFPRMTCLAAWFRNLSMPHKSSFCLTEPYCF